MRVLLTGANGYIGRRLKHALIQKGGDTIRLMVRSPDSLSEMAKEACEIIRADVMYPETLDVALNEVDVAYYLIHGLTHSNFRDLDRQSAQNFLDACIRQNVKKIIYLGGLGDKQTGSEHLLSRIETGEILSSAPDKVQCIWFRAGVIIGSGSASFEIIRNLVQKLPIMITPKWVSTLITPIGVEDVVHYLVAALELNNHENYIIDLGEEAMSYSDLMLRIASSMGLKRYLIPVNVLTPKLSSYWLTIFTPVPYGVASSLIEGLKSEVVTTNTLRHELFDIHPHTLEEAVHHAIEEIESNQVISRWSDSGAGSAQTDSSDNISNAIFTDRRIIDLGDIPVQNVYKSFCMIGGESGWFGYDWLWKIRGMIDKLFGGAGINRGRRDMQHLRIGDSVDFWKVVDLVENERLLLFAQMKLPGKAWLEFKIHDHQLIQSAYFYPDGVSGRLYWYVLIPVHHLIFSNMALSILKRAKNLEKKG